MVCINSCVIGFALVGGMIMTMLSTNKSKVFIEFENLLDNKQKKYIIILLKKELKYIL